MTDFETVLCCLLIPMAYALCYYAGKCDFFNVMCQMFVEKAKEMERELNEAIKESEEVADENNDT